jgi:PAS domain S-box-containing protein
LDNSGLEAMAADLPVFGIHDGATMVHSSPELASMFGYSSAEDVVGQSALGLVDPAHRDQLIQAAMSNGGGPCQSVGLRTDGTRFRVELSAYLIQYEGSIARLVLVRDLSPLSLVVDDNIVIRNMMCLLLRQLGYRALAAESVESALKIFRRDVFALVLTDIVMPRSEGTELVSRVRALDPYQPILIMSGTSDHPLKLDEHSRFIRKPFGLEDLAVAIGDLPDRAKAGRVT